MRQPNLSRLIAALFIVWLLSLSILAGDGQRHDLTTWGVYLGVVVLVAGVLGAAMGHASGRGSFGCALKENGARHCADIEQSRTPR